MGKGTNPACFNTPSGSPASFAATGIFNYEPETPGRISCSRCLQPSQGYRVASVTCLVMPIIHSESVEYWEGIDSVIWTIGTFAESAALVIVSVVESVS